MNDSECGVILMIAWRKGRQGQQVDLNTAKEKGTEIHLAFPCERSKRMCKERVSVITSARGPAVSDEQLTGRLRRSMGSLYSYREDTDVFLDCTCNHNKRTESKPV